MRTIVFTLLLVCCLRASAFADPNLPAIVTDGLSAYQKSGSNAAIEVWLKGSQLENDSSAEKINIEGVLAGFENAYGKMIGFELIGTKVFSPSSKRIYLLIKLEKHPLYAALDCYHTPDGWIIPVFGFNLSAQEVLPPAFFGGI